MKVIVFLEHRFIRAPDGTFWTSSAFPNTFWQRYLEIYDEVVIVGRAEELATLPDKCLPVSGGRVCFQSVPYFVGPLQYIKRKRDVHQAIKSALGRSEAVILRVPGTLGSIAYGILSGSNQPFGVEVVGDPEEVFAPGAFSHPLRSFFRLTYTLRLRRQCRQAVAVAYVTRNALQRKYPARTRQAETSYSSVELNSDAYVWEPRVVGARPPFTVLTIASLAQAYKRVDVLIEAVARCVRSGLDVHLRIVGDGQLRSRLEQDVERLDMRAHVHFVGLLPSGGAIREEIDRAHLFVLASQTEGLPRAMIEAMARGVPCVGTRVGGIPELLDEAELVLPNDAAALADAMRAVLQDPDRMARLSHENLEKASEYANGVLQGRREWFYNRVKEATAKWQRSTAI